MSDDVDADRHPGGRPSKYDPAMCERAHGMAEAGAVDHEIAQVLGISLSTLYVWKGQFPEFREALKRGKAVADDAVEAALFRRATGYSHDAVKIITVSIGNGCSEVREIPFVEHHAPDTTAAIFWLKNRRPNDWRDKREVEHSGDINTGVDLSRLSKAERDEFKRLLLASEERKTAAEGATADGDGESS